jgi:cathepsin A (carboxypeptidase C)
LKINTIIICWVWILLKNLSVIQAAPEEDLIKNLPRLDSPAVTFRQYGGYLDTQSPRRLYYWFMESQGNPEKDPVMIWITGGPGCSGLGALLNYQGLWEMYRSESDGHQGAVRLKWKEMESSWNKGSSLLYIDQPAGTGFSYSLDGNITTNDGQIAKDNRLAIENFFWQKFPEYRSNDIYIFGESSGATFAIDTVMHILERGFLKLSGLGLSSPTIVEDIGVLKFWLVYQRYYGILGEPL